MEVESTSGLLQQTRISFVQNFLFSCPFAERFPMLPLSVLSLCYV